MLIRLVLPSGACNVHQRMKNGLILTPLYKSVRPRASWHGCIQGRDTVHGSSKLYLAGRSFSWCRRWLLACMPCPV